MIQISLPSSYCCSSFIFFFCSLFDCICLYQRFSCGLNTIPVSWSSFYLYPWFPQYTMIPGYWITTWSLFWGPLPHYCVESVTMIIKCYFAAKFSKILQLIRSGLFLFSLLLPLIYHFPLWLPDKFQLVTGIMAVSKNSLVFIFNFIVKKTNYQLNSGLSFQNS